MVIMQKCVRCGRPESEHERLDHRFDPVAPAWMRALNKALGWVQRRTGR